MTFTEYAQELRANRSKLTGYDPYIQEIFDNGTAAFAHYMLQGNKAIGVKNGAIIAEELSNAEQTELLLMIETSPTLVMKADIVRFTNKITGKFTLK